MTLVRFTFKYAGWPKKSTVSHHQISKNIVLNRIKVCNEIIFLRQIEEMIKHYNIIRRY